MKRRLAFLILSLGISLPTSVFAQAKTLGKIEKLDPALDSLIAAETPVELLAEKKFEWSEGPLWLKDQKALIFSDIPRNMIWKWSPDSLAEFIKPSGYTGAEPFTGREPGANGLAMDSQGRLILCQHGDRRLAVRQANGTFKTLVDKYNGKRFNSPNDLTIAKNGDIFFTDPPYGLPKQMEDPGKELDFQGVYRLNTKGELTLLTKEMTRPNGIALSPDEKTLYVANSDPALAIWKKFEILPDGALGPGKVVFDATPWVKEKKPGLPDGLKVDDKGNLFATGPGGVLILTPEGKLLGLINTGVPTANCGWGGDGTTLYITADKNLCRVKTKTKGLGW